VMSNETDYPQLLDVVGYNYQEYRYEDDHKKFPKRIIYGSENGKSYDAWKAVEDNEFIAGQFLWTGLDFLGEARSWPNRSSSAGLIDMAGFPKPYYYQRKAMWTSDPTVHFAVSKIIPGDNRQRYGRPQSHWNWTEGDSLTVVGFANTTAAELLINGKSQGKKSLVDNPSRTFTWKVKFEAGEISLAGYNGATAYRYKQKSTGEPTTIALTSQQTKIRVHQDSIAHVEINLQDENKIPVKWQEKEIEVTVTGPGKLLGLESGDVDSHENYQSNKRKTLNGKLMVYVRAMAKGTINVEAKSIGMTSGQITIQAIP
jgi:beta-galactosidase